MPDIDRTRHYTTKAEQICGNLISYIPSNVTLIEPFVGDKNLVSLFPNATWELYDLDDKGYNIVQDTLINPPDYTHKWVITNPPYLARNKAKDKTIFNKYNTDDLYKAALLSILDCDGGILIIPTNFLTDERTGPVRTQFLNKFQILEMNIFTEPIFESTTYSVCSFAFQRKIDDSLIQNFYINSFPSNKRIPVTINNIYDYRIAGDFYSMLNTIQPIFGRLVGTESSDFITHMKLYAIDTRTERIHIAIEDTPFYGKNTDRTYATFTCKYNLTLPQEELLADLFNKELESFRSQYSDIPMTNYRDYNRKRIGFTFAYQLLTKIYLEKIQIN